MEEARSTELDSGLRVVTEQVPSVRSIALGLWVRTGSRDETPAQAGVSHFLEHLLFKGTERYSSVEISEIFDGLGAQVNAATSKETTHLYARFLDTHLDRAFDLLSEMFLEPTYPDIDSERDVVLEEIAMYEDEPSDRVHDVLDEAVFGEHPLGRRILGAAEVISSIPVPDIAGYHGARYRGANIVVAAAGNLEHDEVVALAEKHLSPSPGEAGGESVEPPQAREIAVGFKQKDTEQFHVCIGGPGISRSDDRRWALSVIDSVFGGSTSSRLFREVREKRGLAYAVGSYAQQFADSGMVALYVGTRADKVAEACEVIAREMHTLNTGGVSEEELIRAKEHVKGRLVLASESTGARMTRLARSSLFDLPLLSLDEMIAEVDAVSRDDVAAVAAALYDPAKLSAAAIGPDEDSFRKALAPLSEALAV